MKQLRLLASLSMLFVVVTSCISVQLQNPESNRAPDEGPVTVSLTRSAEWRLTTADDFKMGTHEGTRIVGVGDGAVTLEDGAAQGTFISAAKQADFAFNGVGVVQQSKTPDGAGISIEVRVSTNGRDWSDWVAVHAEEPKQGEKDDADSQVITVKEGRYLQLRIHLTANGQAPVLESVAVTYIDAFRGPNMEEAKRAILPKGPGQPTIISRKGWGANERYRYDADGKEIWPAEYRRPEKIAIHHTLTPNDETNYPAMVRAIYYYHAVTLGWGDIGYHYLIDPAGNIYEGRRGDGVVGGHSYGHNYGSIGIAVLGDYSSTNISDAARKSLVELLTWLSDKYTINPQGRSFFVDRELPNIFGHRDANQTSCPGGYLYARLPDIRKAVFDKLPASSIKIESPLQDAYVSSPQTVKLAQQDKWSLTRIDYFVDDKLAASLKGPDFTWKLDPSKYDEGRHVLKVVATNALGKQTTVAQSFNVRRPPASTWYFAEGSTTKGFHTWLLLMNANLTPARATITMYDEAGKTSTREVQVPAKSRLNVFVNDLAPNKALGMKVESDKVIYAERAMYFGHDGHTSTGVASPSAVWYFAEGSNEQYFDTWLLVLNPNDTAAKLNLTYYKTDGSVVSKRYEVRPNARLNISPKADLPNAAFSLKIEANVPIVAERSMYFDSDRGGHNTFGATNTSRTWYFAEGATGPDTNTWILVLNPNTSSTKLTATFVRESGQAETATFVVPPTSRMNIWVNKVISNGAVATKIESDLPIVAERSMYWANWRGGHISLGAIAPAKQWFLPEGSTVGFNEWLLILNAESQPAHVTVTLVDERGNALVRSYEVRGNARLNIWLNQVVVSSAVSALVQSDRAIVVERSSYTADNQGGTNSMGVSQ